MKPVYVVIACLVLAFGVSACAAGDAGLPYEKQPTANLTVAGQPTLRHLQALRDKGYTTIINLRPEGEFDDYDEATEVVRLGMDYVHIPVKNVQSITVDDAKRLHAAISQAAGPVLLHCTVGWRAGSLWAIEQHLLHGVSREAAIELVESAHMEHAGEDVEAWLNAHDKQ